MELFKEKGMMNCAHCGYNKCWAAIEFHHLDPRKKEFKIAKIIRNLPSKKRIAELDKVIPLCANCHSEFHAGIWDELEDFNLTKEDK